MKIFIFDYIGVRIFVRISPIITIGEIIFFIFSPIIKDILI